MKYKYHKSKGKAGYKLKKTRHCQQRFQQRGRSDEDVELMLTYGSKRGDGIVLTKTDATEAANQLRHQNNRQSLQRISHITGWRFVICEGALITAYPLHRRVYRPRRRARRRWRGGNIRFVKGV